MEATGCNLQGAELQEHEVHLETVYDEVVMENHALGPTDYYAVMTKIVRQLLPPLTTLCPAPPLKDVVPWMIMVHL